MANARGGGTAQADLDAFGASEEIWGAELLPEVRRNLAAIAQAIAQFEPVSMLVREEELDLARGLVGPAVELVAAPLDDLWMRDTGPVFVEGNGTRAGINFNFNGWGEKQDFDQDAGVADIVTGSAGVESLPTDLILEAAGSRSTAKEPPSSPKAACSTTTATPDGPRRTSRPN